MSETSVKTSPPSFARSSETPPPPASAPAHESDFSCAICLELLWKPCVCPCGHTFCFWCLSRSMDPYSKSACPLCREPFTQFPRPCLVLTGFLMKAFPVEYARREKENKESEEAGSGFSPDVVITKPTVVPTPSQPSTGPEQPRPRPGVITMSEYLWYGVGCDGCGVMPIKGKRFRCSDCPEQIGFDLCLACYDRRETVLTGRFAQSHKPTHRLEMVPPEVTFLHRLQAANPTLSVNQIVDYLRMAQEEDEEDEDPSPPPPPPPRSFQQHAGPGLMSAFPAPAGHAGPTLADVIARTIPRGQLHEPPAPGYEDMPNLEGSDEDDENYETVSEDEDEDEDDDEEEYSDDEEEEEEEEEEELCACGQHHVREDRHNNNSDSGPDLFSYVMGSLLGGGGMTRDEWENGHSSDEEEGEKEEDPAVKSYSQFLDNFLSGAPVDFDYESRIIRPEDRARASFFRDAVLSGAFTTPPSSTVSGSAPPPPRSQPHPSSASTRSQPNVPVKPVSRKEMQSKRAKATERQQQQQQPKPSVSSAPASTTAQQTTSTSAYSVLPSGPTSTSVPSRSTTTTTAPITSSQPRSQATTTTTTTSQSSAPPLVIPPLPDIDVD